MSIDWRIRAPIYLPLATVKRKRTVSDAGFNLTDVPGTKVSRGEESTADNVVEIPSSFSSEAKYNSCLPDHVLMYENRDAVSLLLEYGQARDVLVTFEETYNASRFCMSAIVNDEVFPKGFGANKRLAKKDAAARALQELYGRGKRQLQEVNSQMQLKLMSTMGVHLLYASDADRVARVSRHVLSTCQKTQFINYTKHKISATFVLENKQEEMIVVGLGTGNRCILGENLSSDGQRVIHSHAEIIARRAFLRYLYNQLLMYDGKTSHPILTSSDNGKLKLRNALKIHLYISRPPCGDASVFHEINNSPKKRKAMQKQGQLRTLIGGGEGVIPTDSEVEDTPDGRERLRVMTCSDKICRWNVLGVQGALLSHFLDPIYLDSLVIGSHMGKQMEHIPRAISRRLQSSNLQAMIQSPYRINNPHVRYPSWHLSDPYSIPKSKRYCLNWTLGDEEVEVFDALTGQVSLKPERYIRKSRVSKLALFELFRQVCDKYGQLKLCQTDYAGSKKSAQTFQLMKVYVGQHFVDRGLGPWRSLQDTRGTDAFGGPSPVKLKRINWLEEIGLDDFFGWHH